MTEVVLTRKELEVLALLKEGKSNIAIGKALNFSDRTAGCHVWNILQKSGFHSRHALAMAAVRNPYSFVLNKEWRRRRDRALKIEIEKLRSEHLTMEQIAQRLDISVARIYTCLKVE